MIFGVLDQLPFRLLAMLVVITLHEDLLVVSGGPSCPQFAVLPEFRVDTKSLSIPIDTANHRTSTDLIAMAIATAGHIRSDSGSPRAYCGD